MFQREVEIMKKINHPHLVKLFEVIDDPNFQKIYLVMEFMARGAILSKQFFQTEITNTGL